MKVFRRFKPNIKFSNFHLNAFFSSSLPCDVLNKFKHSMDLHEHEQSCMKVPQNLKKMSSSEMIHNRIAAEFLAKTDELELYYTDPSLTDKKETNSPANSFIQIRVPLQANKELRNKYILFRPESIRIGRVLEALDFTATFVSYLHCKNVPFSRACTMITVCVDHLKFFTGLRGDRNLIVNAYPTFSGKSTVEIRTDLYQEVAKNDFKMAASSLFLMAARDYKEYSKPYFVPKLSIDDPEKQTCLLRYELGKLNQTNRKLQVTNSLFKSPPSEEESLELHEIFLKIEKSGEDSSIKYMRDTQKTKSLLMHSQERNIHGKIFGGYLMKESIEFARIIALTYTDGHELDFEAIDDFNFLNYVDIGSILDFEAMVTYTHGNLIHVRVEAIKYPKVLRKGEKEFQKCTEMHITFKCPGKPLEPIYPASYEEAMIYLESKRRVMKQMELNI